MFLFVSLYSFIVTVALITMVEQTPIKPEFLVLLGYGAIYCAFYYHIKDKGGPDPASAIEIPLDGSDPASMKKPKFWIIRLRKLLPGCLELPKVVKLPFL